jgi:hypothetical protein
MTQVFGMQDNSFESGGKKTYHCGTLTYTKIGSTAISAWLSRADFCLTLMEVVMSSVLPLKLK